MCDEIIEKLEGLLQAYPEDIFTPVNTEEHEKLRAYDKNIGMRVATDMARHINKTFISPALKTIKDQECVIKAYGRDIEKFKSACVKANISDEYSPESAVSLLSSQVSELSAVLEETKDFLLYLNQSGVLTGEDRLRKHLVSLMLKSYTLTENVLGKVNEAKVSPEMDV